MVENSFWPKLFIDNVLCGTYRLFVFLRGVEALSSAPLGMAGLRRLTFSRPHQPLCRILSSLLYIFCLYLSFINHQHIPDIFLNSRIEIFFYEICFFRTLLCSELQRNIVLFKSFWQSTYVLPTQRIFQQMSIIIQRN